MAGYTILLGPLLLLVCEGGCGTHKRMALSGAVEAERLDYRTTKAAQPEATGTGLRAESTRNLVITS